LAVAVTVIALDSNGNSLTAMDSLTEKLELQQWLDGEASTNCLSNVSCGGGSMATTTTQWQ
jgi:hypothetical protein